MSGPSILQAIERKQGGFGAVAVALACEKAA
jgi:hypothetical protein